MNFNAVLVNNTKSFGILSTQVTEGASFVRRVFLVRVLGGCHLLGKLPLPILGRAVELGDELLVFWAEVVRKVFSVGAEDGAAVGALGGVLREARSVGGSGKAGGEVAKGICSGAVGRGAVLVRPAEIKKVQLGGVEAAYAAGLRLSARADIRVPLTAGSGVARRAGRRVAHEAEA